MSSMNGNTTALAGVELMKIAEIIGCPIEVNIFYRTPKRMKVLLDRLNQIKLENSLEVDVLGESPDARIPGLEGPRANCCSDGIYSSDVILVPLEDGDRCEALVAMGKKVIVVDLNPLSRSSKMANVTIVDEISRVANNMLNILINDELLVDQNSFNNEKSLQSSLNLITKNLSN